MPKQETPTSQGSLFAFASNCADCDVDLSDWGRNQIRTPLSNQVIGICNPCAAHRAAGLKGEIQTEDGTIYRYLYLPHSQVTSFCLPETGNDSDEFEPDAEESSGSYSPKYGTFWVTGTKPYKHLEELADKFLKICPDAQERAAKFHQ